MEGPWTILELAELAAETLAAAQPAVPSAGAGAPSGPARANGRVRDVPNERLVRWYVTVGLVDPPLSRRGRIAQYGRRHLLQLVAVKRRQAEGRSLAEIQAELAGATDETLAAVACVPDSWPTPEALPAAPARFWARQARRAGTAATERTGRPMDVAGAGIGQQGAAAGERTGQPTAAAAAGTGRPPTAAAVHGGQEERGGAMAAAGLVHSGQERRGPMAPSGLAHGGQEERGGAMAAAGLVHGIRLAPGVTLLLEGAGREPGPDDLTAIVNAAQPLLEELASRRLRAWGPGHLPDVPGPSPGEDSSPRGARHDH
jgi:DNA-binding transcriptional MerR regulator